MLKRITDNRSWPHFNPDHSPIIDGLGKAHGKIVVVVGNGPSRFGIDLRAVCSRAVTIGCNDVWSEAPVNWVVAMDREAAARAGARAPGRVISPWLVPGTVCPKGGQTTLHAVSHLSGPVAVSIAMGLEPRAVFLLGFDDNVWEVERLARYWDGLKVAVGGSVLDGWDWVSVETFRKFLGC